MRQQRYNSTRMYFLKKKLAEIKNPTESIYFNFISKNFSKDQITFLKCLLRNNNRHPMGRRFTFEEKCMAAAMYKQGPKSYRFLANMFPLPNRQSLIKHTAQIHFDAGIKNNILLYLKNIVKKMKPVDKLCVVSFDEVSVKAGLEYCKANDRIDGFVDFGEGNRSTELADHALTFMVRGVQVPYKVSVAYFLIDSSLKSNVMSELIKIVLKAIFETGKQYEMLPNCLVTIRFRSPYEYLFQGLF